jgi:MoaA/NifB/PqqE/SkfB family radical SAM enzyme
MVLMDRVRRRARLYARRAAAARKWLYYSMGHTRPPIYPDRLYIESTNVCNLRCIMCPTGLGTTVREKGYMDMALFRRIVDEMAPHVKATTPHIWGEPLLHPNMMEMIAYCRERGLHSEISTNAVLLDEAASQAILDAGLGTIYLCMDGATKETYEQVRRNGNFEETTENIQRFLRMKTEYSGPTPEAKLQLVEIGPTADEVEDFRAQWALPGVDRINIKAFDSWGDQIGEISELRAQENNVLTTRFQCPNLWYHAHIYWDGTLVRCDRDFDAVGALGSVSDGVMKAWRGDEMAQLRRQHVSNDLDDIVPCNNCVEWAWWKPTLFTSQGNVPVAEP